jgi:predicted sulfurtransferase
MKLKQGAIFPFLLVLLGCFVANAHETIKPAPLGIGSDGSAKVQVDKAKAADVERVSVDELKAKIAKNEPVIIIDSRTQAAYDSSDSRIKGAIRIPLDEVEARLKEIPRDKEIVTYCT